MFIHDIPILMAQIPPAMKLLCITVFIILILQARLKNVAYLLKLPCYNKLDSVALTEIHYFGTPRAIEFTISKAIRRGFVVLVLVEKRELNCALSYSDSLRCNG